MRKRIAALAVLGILYSMTSTMMTASAEDDNNVEAVGTEQAEITEVSEAPEPPEIPALEAEEAATEEPVFTAEATETALEGEELILDVSVETEAPKLTDTVSKQILEHQAELEKQAEEAEKLYEKYTGENFAMFVSYPAGNIVENTNAIYDFLRNSLGLNHAAACGVLANIQCESNFTSTAIGDGGTSYGVCQWHLERFTRLIGWCNANGYDYHLIPGQMGYLKAELESGYPGVYQYLLNVPDTAQGAYDAAYFWCRYFEIPANVEYHSVMRAKLAQNEFFPRTLGVGSTEVEKEEEELLLEVDRGELFLSNWLFKNNSEASIQKIWEDTSMRSTQWTFEKQSWEISD